MPLKNITIKTVTAASGKFHRKGQHTTPL